MPRNPSGARSGLGRQRRTCSICCGEYQCHPLPFTPRRMNEAGMQHIPQQRKGQQGRGVPADHPPQGPGLRGRTAALPGALPVPLLRGRAQERYGRTRRLRVGGRWLVTGDRWQVAWGSVLARGRAGRMLPAWCPGDAAAGVLEGMTKVLVLHAGAGPGPGHACVMPAHSRGCPQRASASPPRGSWPCMCRAVVTFPRRSRMFAPPMKTPTHCPSGQEPLCKSGQTGSTPVWVSLRFRYWR